jgi:hypothetical protein
MVPDGWHGVKRRLLPADPRFKRSCKNNLEIEGQFKQNRHGAGSALMKEIEN